MAASKSEGKIDQKIGDRVKARRLMLNITQEALAEKLGISFQQVQKYEKGGNRVSASRLQRMSEVLDVPIGYFFDERTEAHTPRGGEYVSQFLTDAQGLALARAVTRISRPEVRKSITRLVQAIAGSRMPSRMRLRQ
jgi:transcriptional regulator with XRE-family HTH domain